MDTKKDLHSARFYSNMRRISGLASLAVGKNLLTTGATEPETTSVRADLFRAIVVFLHASFEDSLRTVARERLRSAPSDVLRGIPLVGISDCGRAEKFDLGALNRYRAKTVNQVIEESVDCYLDRESFGSATDIDKMLCKMGLDTNPFKPFYPDLDRMMKRRHRIVHEADLPGAQDSDVLPWTLGDYFDLCLWNLAVLAFYALLRVSIDPADELQAWYFAGRTKAIELARQVGEEIIALRDQPVGSIGVGLPLVPQLQMVIQKLARVTAHLGPPSHEELVEIASKMQAR